MLNVEQKELYDFFVVVVVVVVVVEHVSSWRRCWLETCM